MDPERIGIAVALFEQGFPEARIEVALTHCSTLESAVEWLSTPMASFAMTSEPARDSTRGIAIEHALSTIAEAASDEAAVMPPDLVVEIRTIRPLSTAAASAWWLSAASRWPSIRQALKDGDDMKDAKRLASCDASGTLECTPTKHPRREGELATSSSMVMERLASTPQGSHQSKVPVESEDGQSANTSPLPSIAEDTMAGNESPKATGVAAQEPAKLLASPKPSSRRANSTPGTSPRAQLQYNKEIETCGICFNDVKKGEAVRLGCRHGWYCSDCMVRHAEARVEVGAAYVACPECVAPIAECNLRRLVSSDIIDRLQARSLEQAVSATSDLWACPTPNCPMRVSIEEGEEPRLRCPTCKKESCLRCGAQPYHKDMSCEEHAAQNRGRGKGSAKADASFKKWMSKTGTKQCPTCKMAVSKQNLGKQHTQFQECHKMMCRNCNTKFCFKCTKVLTDNFNCGCSINAHGFVNPFSGKRVEHIRKKVGKGKSIK